MNTIEFVSEVQEVRIIKFKCLLEHYFPEGGPGQGAIVTPLMLLGRCGEAACTPGVWQELRCALGALTTFATGFACISVLTAPSAVSPATLAGWRPGRPG
jgi:hypothetical protein